MAAAGGPRRLGVDGGDVVAGVEQRLEAGQHEPRRAHDDEAQRGSGTRAPGLDRACAGSCCACSAERWSTNRMPSRWSISCCTQRASRPSAVELALLAMLVSGSWTCTACGRVTSANWPGRLRQPSSAVARSLGAPDDLGIDQHHRASLVAVGDVEHDQPLQRRRPAARRGRCPAPCTWSRTCRPRAGAARRRPRHRLGLGLEQRDAGPAGSRAGP